MSRVFPWVSCIALGAIVAGCGSSATPVSGLTITELALYQGVKVSLMTGGQEVTGLATPLAIGRDAMFRVYVQPEAGWKAREVKGVLSLSTATQKFPGIEAKATISGVSTEADLNSTLTFDVPGERILADFQYKVALYETVPPVSATAPTPASQAGGFFPATGTAKLVATDVGPSVKIKLVPMRYTADGSNRLPDTTEAQLAVFRNMMKEMYPVPKVEITVHEPIDLGTRVGASTGWSQALDQLIALRRSEAPTANIYYYGVFVPADSFGTYCSGGCITGLSAGTSDPDNATLRASIGLGYGGSQAESSAGTFVHEVGHAHGRSHSPCGGAGGPDPRYPYRGGVTGVWGYSIVDKRLRSPSDTKDFMGYCDPIWVSDFTWKALLDRIAHVNWLPAGQLLTASESLGESPSQAYWILHHTEDGLVLGSRLELDEPPTGELVDAELLGEDGRETGKVQGRFYPFDHLAGGLVFVKEADLHGHSTLVLAGRALHLPERLRSLGR